MRYEYTHKYCDNIKYKKYYLKNEMSYIYMESSAR